MAITDATEFSTFDDDGDTNGSGVITADTFNEWRKKTNGIINKLAEISAAGGGGFNRKVIVTNYMDLPYAFPDSDDDTLVDPITQAAIDSTVLRTTWVSPYSGLARVTCIAGGGGGGTGGNNLTHGTGGGGGEIAISLITLISGTTYNISIGQGGLTDLVGGGGVIQGAQQNSGGNTSWQGGIILANGGAGGFNGKDTAFADSKKDGGAGGTGGTGDYLIPGGDGFSRDLDGGESHGGDSYGTGGKAGTTSRGAFSPLEGHYGGGGGGAHSTGSGVNGSGAKGAPGAIIIEF